MQAALIYQRWRGAKIQGQIGSEVSDRYQGHCAHQFKLHLCTGTNEEEERQNPRKNSGWWRRKGKTYWKILAEEEENHDQNNKVFSSFRPKVTNNFLALIWSIEIWWLMVSEKPISALQYEKPAVLWLIYNPLN